MTNRFPLIFNGDSDQIQELAADDNLDLQGSGIRNGVGAQFTGVVTATTFDGNATTATTATNASGLTGTPEITVSTITGVAATFTGAVSVGGTLTYEDVTNVDSIGVITARSGVHFGATGSGTLVVGDADGIGIGTDNPAKPLHVFSATGDSMTRFESGDATIQVELNDSDGSAAIGAVGNDFRILTSGGGGDERLRITQNGNVAIGTDTLVSTNSFGETGLLVHGGTPSPASQTLWLTQDSTNSHGFVFARRRGLNAVADNANLGNLDWQGWGGSGYGSAVRLHAEVDGTPSGSTVAGELILSTNNGSAFGERLRVRADGRVAIGNTVDVNFAGAANGSTTEVLRLDNDNSNSNDDLTTRIAYRRSGNSGTQLYTTLDSVRTGTHDTDFVISNNVGTVLTERLRISAQGTFKFNNGALIEHGDTLTAARNGTQTIDLSSGMVIRCSTASAGTWKPNFRVDSNISLNTAMNDNDIISPTMIVAKGATTHFSNTIQIDGSDVTPEFLGGAPTDGGGSGTFDIYSYTIMKTGDATFVAFCSVNTYE